MEEKGIKESKELIIAVKEIAKFAYGVGKDKKIGADDLEKLVELGKKFDEIMEGFKGLNEIKEEMKNLDEMEVVELISLMYASFKEIKGE